MTLWSTFERLEPSIASQSGVALSLVRSRDLPDMRSYQDLGFSKITADIASDPATVDAGIYGRGAWVLDSDEVVPVLFVQHGMADPGGMRLEETDIGVLIPPALRDELANVRAIPLAQPSAYATTLSSGAAITVGSRSATAGIWVRCRSTKFTGFLTAGHAAPTTNVLVRDRGGTAVGTVRKSVHSQIGSSIIATADVALVEAKGGVESGRPGLPVHSVAPRDHVTLQTSRGSFTSWIRGLSPSFALSPTEQPWGDVAITADAISVAGDSGAPIAANGYVVASLVGGGRQEYSVVQDIEYQLEAIDVDPI